MANLSLVPSALARLSSLKDEALSLPTLLCTFPFPWLSPKSAALFFSIVKVVWEWLSLVLCIQVEAKHRKSISRAFILIAIYVFTAVNEGYSYNILYRSNDTSHSTENVSSIKVKWIFPLILSLSLLKVVVHFNFPYICTFLCSLFSQKCLAAILFYFFFCLPSFFLISIFISYFLFIFYLPFSLYH